MAEIIRLPLPNPGPAPGLAPASTPAPEGLLTHPADIEAMASDGNLALLTEQERQLWDHALQVPGDPLRHNANLALFLDDRTLGNLGEQLREYIEWDEESRKDWFRRESDGIRLLGVTDKRIDCAPFDGASRVVHPMLVEACIQFQSRAIAELWPAGGPAKAIVLGHDPDYEKQRQATRVADFLNYQYTQDIPGAFEGMDALLMRLPLAGSMFKRIAYDPLLRKLVLVTVQPQDFLVPYTAQNLLMSTRHTEIVRMPRYELLRRMQSDQYRHIDLPQPDEELWYENEREVQDAIDDSESRHRTNYDNDNRHTLAETLIELMLPELPLPEALSPRSHPVPYLVTWDRDETEILSIRRAWREGDPTFRKRLRHTHYRFMPGFGFYGWGLYHLLGSLAEAATGSLRSLLDAAQFDNLQGGFQTAGVDLKEANDGPLSPGEWRKVNATYEELSKAFFRIPFSPPSQTMFSLLGYIDEVARRLASTTEAMVGEGANNVPVGTQLARIEQGTKIFSAIHKRLHRAQGEELKLVAELNRDTLPPFYPYEVENASRMVFARDFDERIDVAPVSDPNIVTNSQRIFLSQYLLELSERAPQLYNLHEVHRRTLEALKIPDIDDLLRPPEAPTPLDPLSELLQASTGAPLRVFPDQDHLAHIQVHEGQLARLQGKHETDLSDRIQAHIQEHKAWDYYIALQQAINIPLPGPDEPLPIEQQNRIAILAANATLATNPYPRPTPQELDAAARAETQNREAQARMQREDRMTASRIAQSEARTTADIALKIRAKEQELLEGRIRPELTALQRAREVQQNA